MLKMKLWYSGHLMWRADSLEKTLMLRKMEGKRSTGQQRMRRLDDITDSMDMSLCKLREIAQGSLVCCNPWSCRVRHSWVTEQQQKGWEQHTASQKRGLSWELWVLTVKLCVLLSWVEDVQWDDIPGQGQSTSRHLGALQTTQAEQCIQVHLCNSPSAQP